MTSILYFDRRKLLGTSGLLIPALLPAFHAHAAQTSSDVVETAEGRLVGVRSSGISVFKGVPYAGSVSGQHRFKAAPPPLRGLEYGTPHASGRLLFNHRTRRRALTSRQWQRTAWSSMSGRGD
jgi:para-nitrobenzyl esterase